MVIVDTSIVYKWLSKEEDSQLSLKILEDFLYGKEELSAPNIILYELANILSLKSDLTGSEAIEAWSLFRDFKIKVYIPDSSFIEKCIEFAKQHSVSAYDSAYAVLALDKKCSLFTADAKFIKQVNLPFIKSLSEYPAS